MRMPPTSRKGSAPRAAVLAAALPPLAAAALLGSTAQAGARCNSDVCLELALPPHVKQVRPDATLEFLVLLPAPDKTSVNVKVVLRGEGGPHRCHARYETLQPGTTWKRVTFRLAEGTSPVAPGEYSAGVARVAKADAVPKDPCAPGREAPRFLARRILVAP